MKIGVVGTGYVGLVQGVIMADSGQSVICMDVMKEKIEMLQSGECPIYEKGLKEIMLSNMKAGRISFTDNMEKTVQESQVIFIAVGTPAKEDGSADLAYVEAVAHDIGKYINDYKVIVDKSTVPVGTGRLVQKIIADEIAARGLDIEFDVVSNPEFLREGRAVHDCTMPDRVVIGTDSEKARKIMRSIYEVFNINETPFVFTNLETAEMIKYASNAFLAVKISFINEMALLAEKVGANVQTIAKAMGMDGRISSKFLHAGPGYGGSCFPKDTKAVAEIAREHGMEMQVIEAAIKANEKQKKSMVQKVCGAMGDLKGRNIAVLGLSFKPETDDMRDAPSLDIVRGLVEAGAYIQAYCPQGMKEAKWRFADIDNSIKYMDDEYEAAKGADAVVLITEWFQFRAMDLELIRNNMRDCYFFDLRNVFSKKPEAVQAFKYYGVGV